MDTFTEIEYVMISLVSVALSKTIGSSTINGKPLMSDTRMQYLNNMIKGDLNIKIEAIINNDDEEIESFNDNDFNNEINNDNYKRNSDTDWVNWSNSVLESAKNIANESEHGNIINACYNPEFAKQVKTRLLPYLPVWTGIMRPYFQRSGEIATSSAVEAGFADIKNRGFKGQLSMRVDKFIVQHLDLLDAKITLASNEKDTTNNMLLTSNKQNIIYNDSKENNTSNISTIYINEE